MQQSDHSSVTRGPLVIASRGSRLALWQANFVRSKLSDLGFEANILEVKTKGDRIQNRFLHEIGGKGVFVREVEQTLADGQADLAVHSLKDLPAVTPDGFELAAILPRHHSGDVLILHPDKSGLFNGVECIGRDLIKEKKGLKIATGSLRRGCLLKEARPDIEVIPLRGNVDTRLQKLRDSDWDGIILAAASLERLENLVGDLEVIGLEPDWFIPSPSQGALVIETLKTHPVKKTVESMSCSVTRMQIDAERAVLKALGGDCTMPIGMHVSTADESGEVRVMAVVLNLNGECSRAAFKCPVGDLSQPENLAGKVVSRLIDNNLRKIMKDLDLILPEQIEGTI